MDEEQTKKDEDRLESFLNLLFGIDSAAMIFFLWFVRGDVLGEARLPFQLAFLPFKPHVLVLAICAFVVVSLRGLNLFWHDKRWFRQSSKLFALVVLAASIIAIGLGGWALIQNPDILSSGKK